MKHPPKNPRHKITSKKDEMKEKYSSCKLCGPVQKPAVTNMSLCFNLL